MGFKKTIKNITITGAIILTLAAAGNRATELYKSKAEENLENKVIEETNKKSKKYDFKDEKGINPNEIIKTLESKINDEYPNDPNTSGWWSLSTIEKFHNRYKNKGYDLIVNKVLEKYGNNLYFGNNEIGLKAILAIESSMGEQKHSKANANGVAHIWKPTEETINNIAIKKGYDFKLTNVMDDEQCIEGAAIYLEYLFEQEEFNKDPYLVAAAYNAGPEYIKQILNNHGEAYENYGFSNIVYDENSKKSFEMGLAAFMMNEPAEYGRKFGSAFNDLENYKIIDNLKKKYSVADAS